MTLEQLKSCLKNDLDFVAPDGGNFLAIFRAEVGTRTGAVLLHIAGNTYSVGSSSTASTKTFVATASAYSRALDFIKAANLRPQD